MEDSGHHSPHDKKTQLKRLGQKILHSNGFLYTLLRSGVSAQVCGWIDTFTGFLVFSFMDLSAWVSTAIGAFVGGVLNGVINYRFTFHAFGVDWRVALAKFAMVWVGSLLLNSFGTQWSYTLASHLHWIQDLHGMSDNAIFLCVRLMVALIVSLGWNFIMQRYFVFTTTRLDPYILRALNAAHLGHSKKTDE